MNTNYTSLLSFIFTITVVNLQAMENEDWVRVSNNGTRTVYKLKESSARVIARPNSGQIRNSQNKTIDYCKLTTILYGLYEKEDV